MRAAATTRRDWLGVEAMGDLSILRGLVRCDARPGVVDLCAGCEGSRVLDRGRRMWGDDSSVGWFNSLSSDSGALACGGLLAGGVGVVLTAAPVMQRHGGRCRRGLATLRHGRKIIS